MLFTKLTQITRAEKQKLNKKMKLLALHQKFMPKKALVMRDMQVEKRQYLLVVESPMDQKEKKVIKK